MADDTPEAAIRKLRSFAMKVDADNARKMTEATLLIERYARIFCPVDEGALRADITSVVAADELEIHGRVLNTLFYAPYVHNGTGLYAVDGNGRKTPWIWIGDSVKYKGGHKTVGQHAQPYILSAVTQNIGAIEGIMGGK